jgi:cyclin-dependent kinase 7
VQLYDVFPYGECLHLVLEYCVGDLTHVIRNRNVVLTEAHVKGYFRQILSAIAFCHACRLMHRDIKPDNVLLSPQGEVKLADFGHAARFPGVDDALFPRVVTLWYRAPELLAGARYYGPAIDIWAAGCVLGELLLRQPLFPGRETERDQLAQIFRLLGTPVDTELDAPGPAPPRQGAQPGSVAVAVVQPPPPPPPTAHADLSTGALPGPFSATAAASPAWPGCTALPGWADYEARPPQPWRTIFPSTVASDGALDLLSRMLVYDPASRISAADALRHPWFSMAPAPAPPESLPLPTSAAVAAATSRRL